MALLFLQVQGVDDFLERQDVLCLLRIQRAEK